MKTKPNVDAENHRLRSGLLWVVVVGLLAFALLPVLNRSHLEGFTYFTETLSRFGPERALADPLWPLLADFFYYSRPGVVWVLNVLAPLAPDGTYNLLMWLTFPLFFGGFVIWTRIAGGVSWLAAMTALLVLPIAIDTQFFTNDNLLAVSLSLWAAIFVMLRRGTWSVILAGVLYSAAVLCRLDQVLLGPFFAVLLLITSNDVRHALRRAGAMALGFALIHGIVAWHDLQAANPFFRISIASAGDALWNRDGKALPLLVARDLSAAMLAFGLGLPAIWAGGSALLRKADHNKGQDANRPNWVSPRALPLLLVGYPFFIYALTVGKYYDPRGFMTMLLMLGPLAAAGLQRWLIGPVLGQRSGAEDNRLRSGLIAAVIVLPVFVPGVPLMSSIYPTPVETENAPQTLTGRIWYGDDWRTWQDTQFHQREAATLAFLARLTTTAAPAAILTTEWTFDRRLQHFLLKSGYSPTPVAAGPCAQVAERWVHPDGAEVTHVRVHIPFLGRTAVITPAIFLVHGYDCLKETPDARRYALWPRGIFTSSAIAQVELPPHPDGYFHVTDTALDLLKDRSTQSVARFMADGLTPREAAEAEVARAQRLLE